ncbi:ABC transporter permease [Nocardia sp. NPDC060249]|uniref:ABC transporter permease n=1 Tax=Nocardia sp. NPDC060249 TaxID=3347082 RepID=UPI00365EDA62
MTASTIIGAVAAPAVTEPPTERPPASSRFDVAGTARFLLRRPGLILSILVVGSVVLAAFVPKLFASGDPLRATPAQRFAPPSTQHWFGTDELGRDHYTRVIHGTALSLQATLIAVGVALVVGAAIGLLAGFVRGWVESVSMRLVDVVLSIPALFLSLALVTALGRGTVEIAVAVGVAGVAGFARVMRAEVLRVSEADYVDAARASGTRWYVVMVRHVLPNARGPVLVLATLELGTAVLAVASLSFLGYGAAPPAPEWGTLIAGGRNYLANAWWLSTLPGLVIVATVLSVNRIAHALDGEWSRRATPHVPAGDRAPAAVSTTETEEKHQ